MPSPKKDSLDGSKVLSPKLLASKLEKESVPKVYNSVRMAPESLLDRRNKDLQGTKSRIQIEELDKFFASSGQVKTALQGVNTSKIQKFIEKQKKRNAAKRTKEQATEQERAMKVHQNLMNLHNFTLKERLKHSKDTSFFTIKRSTHQDVEKKRKPSLEDGESSRSERVGRQRKVKIQPLRIRPKQKKMSPGLDHDLEDTIQIDSSRMDVDNSIINIYRRVSGSNRKSSNDSKNRSALRSSSGDPTSPYRRSLSGG